MEVPADVCRYFWPTINLVSLVLCSMCLLQVQPGWPEVPQREEVELGRGEGCRREPSRHPCDEYPCSSACIGGEEDL